MSQNWADPNWAEQTIAAQNVGRRMPEARQRNSEGTQALWRDPEYREKMEAHLGSEERRAEFSAQRLAAWKRGCYDGVFQNPSSIEIQFAAALQECAIPFTVQYRLEGDSRPFDFFIPPRLLVEVDGEYWHSLPGADERDAAKTELAKERGFILRRVPERAFREKTPLDIVQERILPLVNEIDSLLELSSR